MNIIARRGYYDCEPLQLCHQAVEGVDVKRSISRAPVIHPEKLDYQRVTHGVALPVLVEVFGHATQRQTLNYLCVQDEEIREVYMNEI